MSLALGQDIKWVQFAKRDEGGTLREIESRNPGLLPFNKGASRLADNWECGNLRLFVERGEKVLVENREWWNITIGLVKQVRGAMYLEVKCSLLNTLLDRISSKVNGDAKAAEIDVELDRRVDAEEFRLTLNDILSTLSTHWDRVRTNALCSTIKEWNARPSFPKKITRSCQKLGISPVSGKRLGFRHVLVHDGEMHSDLENPEDRVQYFFEIEMVVLLLLIRLLGFDGYIYLQSNPPDPKKVAAFLAESTQQNGGR